MPWSFSLRLDPHFAEIPRPLLRGGFLPSSGWADSGSKHPDRGEAGSRLFFLT